MALEHVKALSPERCLNEPTDQIATRCPNIAGRRYTVDGKPLAILDRLDKRGTFACDKDGSEWRCRRIVVLNRDLRTARARNPQAFLTAGELLKTLATASTVKLEEELGALGPPMELPRTCIELPKHGCAVQAARLKTRAPDRAGTPRVRRRLWLVEDADGPLLACSDAALSRCDELTAAGWQAIAVTLRPSSLAAAEPPPEIDLPETRTDKRPMPTVVGGAEAQDTPVGTLDPYLRPKGGAALPPKPANADLAKLTKVLDSSGRTCLKEQPRADVEMILGPEGVLNGFTVDGDAAGTVEANCLEKIARRLPLPRFSGAPYRFRAVVLRRN